jgi:hypothetical protein
LVGDKDDSKRAKFGTDYIEQKNLIPGMQACMGENCNPRLLQTHARSESGTDEAGKNGVTQNVHNCDVWYTTFTDNN